MTTHRVIEICGEKVIDHKWKQVSLQEIGSQKYDRTKQYEKENIRTKCN